MLFKNILAAGAAISLLATPAIAGDHGDKKMSKSEKVDIVDTAIAAGSFGTLVAAVQAAGLEATLRSDGPFTVFAPTDAAFAALPDGTVENLLKPENKDQLTAILTYHVVSGKTKSKSLAGKTLNCYDRQRRRPRHRRHRWRNRWRRRCGNGRCMGDERRNTRYRCSFTAAGKLKPHRNEQGGRPGPLVPQRFILCKSDTSQNSHADGETDPRRTWIERALIIVPVDRAC